MSNIDPHFAENADVIDENHEKCYREEISSIQVFDHPNIVKIYDYSLDSTMKTPEGNNEQVFYIAMEYLSRQCLFDYLAQDFLFPPRVVKHYFRQIMSAL